MQHDTLTPSPIYAQPLVVTRAQRAIRTAAHRDACNELLQAWHALQTATRRHHDTSLQRARFNAAMDAVQTFAN